MEDSKRVTTVSFNKELSFITVETVYELIGF